ncbi:MAG: TrbG/VirB9 family P-type conjugative transfer protein, partial [Alphaproteobacteria bacterium]
MTSLSFRLWTLSTCLAILAQPQAMAQIRPPMGNPSANTPLLPSGGAGPRPSGGGGLLGGGSGGSGGGSPNFIDETEREINAQAAGQYPTMDRNSNMPLGALQKQWNAPTSAAGQVAPGIVRYVWRPDFVMAIRTREFMTTTIELPEWENVEQIILGDAALFEASRIKGNILVVRPSYAGADTNMTVLGTSGNIYNFYVRSEGWNSNQISDLTVYISATNPKKRLLDVVASGDEPANTPTEGMPDESGVTPPDYIRKIAFKPDNLRFDLKIFSPAADDLEIAPLRVFTDGVWTYFDYGDKADTVRRPVIFHLVDEVESMVNTRTVGPKGNIMIAEAVGNFVLRNGKRIICVYHPDYPRSFEGSKGMPKEYVEPNSAERFFEDPRYDGGT